ncbi:hypothetical protein Sjap_007876 [Stephania japonica]|uniref:Uncharacterized protein n=1 Tax=Stephania japonica TaxID=461633 RepID=A0AAP0JQS8_9MAGN
MINELRICSVHNCNNPTFAMLGALAWQVKPLNKSSFFVVLERSHGVCLPGVSPIVWWLARLHGIFCPGSLQWRGLWCVLSFAFVFVTNNCVTSNYNITTPHSLFASSIRYSLAPQQCLLLPIPPIPTTELQSFHLKINQRTYPRRTCSGFQKNKNRFSVMQHFKNYMCISLQ